MTLKARLGPGYCTIVSYAGLLTIGLGFILLLPLVLLLFPPHDGTHLSDFALPGGTAILLGFCLWRGFRPPQTSPITTPDAALIVVVVWILSVLWGAMPFILAHLLSPLSAIFEAMSGWTTTGLTMVDPDTVPPIFLLWRSLMQFVGGAGLAVMMLSAIVGSLGPGVYEAEARTEHLVPHVMHTARMIIKIYLAYAIIGFLLYYAFGMGSFDALCHTMSGLATGGFSTRSMSIGYWNSPGIEMVSLFLMLLGTTSFATHHVILTSRGKKGWRDAELSLMALLIIVAVLLTAFYLFRSAYTSLGQSFRKGAFQVVSALTGTGYSTTSLTRWREFPLFVLIILMLIEGGTGSTAGGIKLYRVAIIARSIWWWIKKLFYPASAVIQRNIWRRGDRLEIEDRHIQAIASFIGLYLFTYLVGVTVFLANGYSLLESMFEFASAMGTVGLSLGITGPNMPTSCKIAEILGMWLGRLEFIAIFHAFIKVSRDIGSGKKG